MPRSKPIGRQWFFGQVQIKQDDAVELVDHRHVHDETMRRVEQGLCRERQAKGI